jgi:penicillin-binding protein 1B
MPVKKAKKAPVKRSRRAKTPPRTPPPRMEPPRQPRRWVKALVLGIILVTVSLTILWRRIDAKVAHRLSSFESPSIPVVYSAPLDLRSVVVRTEEEGGASKALLRGILADRRYAEVTSPPSRPGEYLLTNDSITIYTRDFTAATGALHKAQKFSLTLRDGRESSPSGQSNRSGQTQRALLEPQIISYLGAQDMRASRFVALDRIPESVQHAVMSIEDERFFSHFGIDLFGIIRAMCKNIIAGRLVQGGSTLTQQLAKNLFLSPKKTISRKLLEIPTALSLERHLSKKQLLELYINEVYLGQEGSISIHGMPQASTTLFGKNISDIAIDEAATLAGIIKAPSYYNPRKHPERAKERRDTVLAKMRDLGHISEGEYKAAVQRPLRISQQQEHRRIAQFFTSTLEAELNETIDIENAPSTGLAVYTGLDLGMQRCAEGAIERGVAALEVSHPKLRRSDKQLQAALVAIEPHSGLVRSWVGGRDFSESQFNRVNLAMRQIGSTVKPFLYLTALDGTLNSYKTATAVSILEDKPMAFQVNKQAAWSPENFDHEFRGDVTLRYALENSLNMPALYIAERIGLSTLKKTLSKFKIAPTVQEVPSIALGALDSNLLRLTAAYGALANGGVYIQPRLFTAAIDGSGERLASSEVVEERVADEGASFVLTNILRGVLDRGTGKGARSKGFDRPAAGKTGTSDNARDAWFVGYTPTLVAGVWLGFDDNSPLSITGGGAAAPIWGDFMKCSAPFLPLGDFSPPPGVTFVSVDIKSGQIATPDCPREHVAQEAFLKGTEPSKRCAHHGGGESSSSTTEEVSSRPRRSDRQSGFWGSIFGR